MPSSREPRLNSRVTLIVGFAIFALSSLGCSPKTVTDISTMDSSPSREIFAPGIISLPDRHEFGSVLTQDGEEMFIGLEHGGYASIVSYKWQDNQWQGPTPVIGSQELSANDPMLSPDGKRLYFISPRSNQYDIGYIERHDNGDWSEPVWEAFPVNSRANEYYISFTREGDLIFATDRETPQGGGFDIMRAHKAMNGTYTLERFPDAINTRYYEADAFIDPDGRYLIYSTNNPDGLGRGDLYISFARDEGRWTQAVSLGRSVNTSEHELCPFVSPNGKWLYYTSGGDIYRISTDVIKSVEANLMVDGTDSSAPKKHSVLADYLSIDDETVLLTNATLHVGDGSEAIDGQSILIEGTHISQTGPDGTVEFPDTARIVNVDGASVLPGFVGMHNHTHMPGKILLKHMAPRLYLAGGVTTMTTAGSADTLGELEMAASIDAGDIPGPTIFPSAHYITGPSGSNAMTKPATVEAAKAYVQEWAERGVSWFKLYRHTEPRIAAAVIEEAHAHGLKVTGHLCSITYAEAATMGIDSLEHGLNPSTDFVTDKNPGDCVPSRASKTILTPDSEALKTLVDILVENDVTLTSTLAILESGFPHRPQADERSLSLMTEGQRTVYDARQARLAAAINTTTSTPEYWELLLAFERNFAASGGHLVAGPDLGRHIFPGYGDQRNFELLVEAGFSIDETIQIMTSNGAETLGVSDKTGLLKSGYEADLIVLNGKLTADTANIKNPRYIFSNGMGFDPDALIKSVEDHIHAE